MAPDKPGPTIKDDNPKPFLTCAEILGLDPAEWTALTASPDHTSMAPNMDGICIIMGDHDAVMDVTGVGLLWIEKKFIIKAGVTFRWEGLIYVGETAATPFLTEDNSEVWIIGAVICGGEFTWKGTHMTDDGVLYSAEAIWQIMDTNDLNGTSTVLSWRER